MSSDQLAAIKAATRDFSAEATKVTGPSGYTRPLSPSKAAEVALLRDRLTVRIRTVLTSEQRVVFEKNLAKSVARRRS